MQISVEISMYPLKADYGNAILEFIRCLKQHQELEIRSNTMSTQIFGDYEVVMQVIGKEMKKAFTTDDAVVMVMKVANLNLRPAPL